MAIDCAALKLYRVVWGGRPSFPAETFETGAISKLVGRGGRALGRARAAKKAALCAAMPLHELRQAREMTQKALASL